MRGPRLLGRFAIALCLLALSAAPVAGALESSADGGSGKTAAAKKKKCKKKKSGRSAVAAKKKKCKRKPTTPAQPTNPTPSPTFELTVEVTGSGSGTVTSSPGGISCPGDCIESYNLGTVVELTATTGAVTMFLGWTGDCTGFGTCMVTMDQSRAVSAEFFGLGP